MSRALLVAASSLGLLAAKPSASLPDVLSPGRLSHPHRTVSGSTRCTECHPAGQRHAQQACLACHEELEHSLAPDAGLHGRLPQRQQRACHTCHREHRGAEAALIDWGREGRDGFDHERAGYPLKLTHRELSCTTCHRRESIARPEVLHLLDERPERTTYLGLPNRCADCHFDEHRGQEKEACDTCHDESRWKRAPRFDHDDPKQARYPLEGQHRLVPCADCHPAALDKKTPAFAVFPGPRSAEYLTFRPLDFKACTDCHEDPHRERMGQTCDDCHTHAGWEVPKLDTREFHDKARFKLEGAHRTTDCRACHGPAPGATKRTLRGLDFERCDACHADAHLGQLRPGDAGAAPDCNACHATDAFGPVRYEEEDHRDAGYPLKDAHRAVACSACHPPTPGLAKRIDPAVQASLRRQGRPERFSFAPLRLPDVVEHPKQCDTCHTDVHQEQFSKREGGCAGCHEGASFSTLSFDHDAGSRFPLDGKHLEVECAACHPEERDGGLPVVRYRPLPLACEGCHADQHVGQLAAPPGKPHPECKRCHTTKEFAPSAFEHEAPFTDFVLKGKHRDVKCEKCHPEVQVTPKLKSARYRPLPTDCEGCHADQHRGAFGGYEP